MNAQSMREALASLLAREGTTILENPRRLEAMLNDLCPEQRRETVLLTGALRERVPEDLLAPVSSLPPQMMRVRLQKRLEERLSVTEGAAVWAVETWAMALGVMSAGEAVSAPVLQTSVLPQSSVLPERSVFPQTSSVPPSAPLPSQPPAGAYTPPAFPSSPPSGYPAAGMAERSGMQSQPGMQSQFGTQNQPGPWPPQPPGTWPPAPNPYAGGTVGYANDSGTGTMAVLPPELKGFNWGAFLMNWVWAISNKSYIGLLALVPYVGLIMAFVLGFKGNEMAWQNRRWTSIEEFKAVQKSWAGWGWGLTILGIIFWIIVLIAGNHSS